MNDEDTRPRPTGDESLSSLDEGSRPPKRGRPSTSTGGPPRPFGFDASVRPPSRAGLCAVGVQEERDSAGNDRPSPFSFGSPPSFGSPASGRPSTATGAQPGSFGAGSSGRPRTSYGLGRIPALVEQDTDDEPSPFGFDSTPSVARPTTSFGQTSTARGFDSAAVFGFSAGPTAEDGEVDADPSDPQSIASGRPSTSNGASRPAFSAKRHETQSPPNDALARPNKTARVSSEDFEESPFAFSAPRLSTEIAPQSVAAPAHPHPPDEDDSPFAFAPPPLQETARAEVPSSPPVEPQPTRHNDEAEQADDDSDCDVFAFRPPRTGEEVPSDPRFHISFTQGTMSPETFAMAMPNHAAFYPEYVERCRAAGMPPAISSEGPAGSTPAASFAQQVQAGEPDWLADGGFTCDEVQTSSRMRRDSRRRAAHDELGPSAEHPAQPRRIIRPRRLDTEQSKDLRSAEQPAIPLRELVPALGADPDDDVVEKADVEAPRKRRTRSTRPPLDELEDSPYPAVQGSVSNIDDHKAAILTIRSWVLGAIFCTIFSALNSFFNLRYPAPVITPIVTQLLSYPIGKWLANAMPSSRLHLPKWSHQYGAPKYLTLNPGPFSIKEHTLLTIMANISTGPAYALNYSLTVEKGFGQPQSAGFDLLLVFTSQIIGFGAAGLCRRFLVWPAPMLWPQNLVFSTVLNTLHAELDDEEEGIPRLRFFVYVIIGAFCWFWLPGFLFTALSAFSWICWMAPDNVVVNQLFGVSSGLGMGLLTFDWSQISYLIPPLVIPWWAQVNIFIGFAIAFWAVAPAIYYTNSWNTAFLPISASAIFDRFGQPYNTTRVLSSDAQHLDEAAYQEYSPIFLPAGFATAYTFQFVLATAILVHTALYHGPTLWRQLRTPHRSREHDDVHMRLMRHYREVPDWWYAALMLLALGLAMVLLGVWDTSMPPWAILIAFSFACIYFIPSGIIFATTAFPFTLNMFAELVAGYLMPGSPKANMLFKIYAVQVSGVGLYYSQDLKLAHYQKVPPRATFFGESFEVIGAYCEFLSDIVGVKRWLVSRVPNLCHPDQKAHLTCPYMRTFLSASSIWGAIGPARLFSAGQMYHPMLYGLILGAILPVITWCLLRRYPRSWLVYVNVPVAFVGSQFMPPATGINFSAPLIIGFIFQYLIRHKKFEWWTKYNFLLSAGLDAGTVFSGILIFFTLQLPKSGTISLNWWGNEVYTRTADWAGIPLKTPPPDGFGPTSW
ncbi:hypothetical protein JCM8202v2_006267 [Rhodotorula sphaerocarpa]